ncbi:MAG: GAF domain-containing protein [Ferruginibacter sp.]
MKEQVYEFNTDYFEPLDLWQENHVYPASNGIVVFIRDISERKRAEQKIFKANRLYFFISQINQMIVRTTDEETLFTKACEIAVDLGKFRMAWIGMIDQRTKKVIPAKHAGEENGFLTKVKHMAFDEAQLASPIAQALSRGEYVIFNDIENDPQMAVWKEAALERGYRSLMALPITKFGTTIGVFSFYASEKNYFDEAEIALLLEATGDVSFALENFEKENLRTKAEAEVVQSEMRYHTLAEVSPVGIFHADADGATTYVNPRWCQMSGISFEEAMGLWLVQSTSPARQG